MKNFRTSLFNLFKSEHAQSVSLDKVKGQISKDFGDQYSEDEIFEAINKMMEANQVMLADDVVFLIWSKCCRERDDQILYCMDLHCATKHLTLHIEYLNLSSYSSGLSDNKLWFKQYVNLTSNTCTSSKCIIWCWAWSQNIGWDFKILLYKINPWFIIFIAG